MQIKKAISSFAYDRNHNILSYIAIYLDEGGTIDKKKQYQFYCCDDAMLDNIISIIDYISEIIRNSSRLESDLIVTSFEIEKLYHVKAMFHLNHEETERFVQDFIINDDEVLEWVNVIYRMLLQKVEEYDE